MDYLSNRTSVLTQYGGDSVHSKGLDTKSPFDLAHSLPNCHQRDGLWQSATQGQIP